MQAAKSFNQVGEGEGGAACKVKSANQVRRGWGVGKGERGWTSSVVPSPANRAGRGGRRCIS